MAEALDLKRFANGFDAGTDGDRLKGPLARKLRTCRFRRG
jgi:hypothetical protein